MKAEIHPNYHTIKVVMTDGTEYLTRSTWGKEGDTLNLDIDPKSHPAWTGGNAQHDGSRRPRLRFQKKFSGFLEGLIRTVSAANEKRPWETRGVFVF